MVINWNGQNTYVFGGAIALFGVNVGVYTFTGVP
jgi:hypothetical protein